MQLKIKKLNYIFLIYWFLLAYIIAALVWWFVALNRQNHQMILYKKQEVKIEDTNYTTKISSLQAEEKRKQNQYIGEGVTFFLLIITGAVFVFRAVRKQIKFGLQQQSFMMALTHELKTPIAVAKLNLETLQKRKLEESQQNKLIQNTLQEANRLNSLCNNMLLSSQMEANGYQLSKEEINYSDLVTASIQDFKTRFSDRKINFQIPPNIFVEGDYLLLQMAINNLIDNAIKYTVKENIISVSLTQQNNTIELQIKDDGKGIADEDKKRVFEKYYRVGNAATKNAKGTGLGLYLTKKITQQHKGNIHMTNNVPNGAIFIQQLPLAVEKN
jgi:two-component system, OmpR family, sensor histidine kinase CiaH